MWWVSVWSRSYRHSIYVEVNPQCFSLVEDVTNLRLELWGEHRVTKMKGWLRYLNSEGIGQFPDDPVKIEAHKFTVETPRRIRNSFHKGDRMRGTIIIINTVCQDFVRIILIQCPDYVSRVIRMTITTRVRDTSPTLVWNTEVQHHWHRSRNIGQVGDKIDVTSSLTSTLFHLLSLIDTLLSECDFRLFKSSFI